MSPTNVDAPGGNIQLRKLPMSGLRTAEGEVGRLRFACTHGDGRLLRPPLLVPGFDRVCAGRQVLDRERPLFSRGREERMWQHADVGMPPAVHVALEWHHHLGRCEGALRGHAGRRLADIEATVHLRNGFDVVQHVVAVLDDDVLANDGAEDAWMVKASILIDRVGRSRRILGAVRYTAVDINEHVAELAVLHDVLRIGRRRRVLAGAGAFLTHVDLRVRRRRAGEMNDARDSGIAGWTAGTAAARLRDSTSTAARAPVLGDTPGPPARVPRVAPRALPATSPDPRGEGNRPKHHSSHRSSIG